MSGARWLAGLLAFAATVASAESAPSPSAAPATLKQRIDAHVDASRFAAASWSIKIVSIDSGKTLYERDANRLLVPASTAKLYTGALALDTFGADYRVSTRLLATARPARDGTLHGDLILQGHGDPTLGTEANPDWANRLAEAVRKAGVRKIDGDLVADATYFAAPSYGGGWEAADLQSWFGVPASALSVGENVVRLTVRPGPRVDSAAVLGFDPGWMGQAFELDNELRTVAPPARSDVSLVRRPGERRLSAFGQVSTRAAESEYRLSLPDPPLMAGYALQRALGEYGVEVVGKLRSVSWPQHETVRDPGKLWTLGDVVSPPLGDILRRGFKLSQNLYLQNLLLLVGAAEAERAGAGAADAPFRSTEQSAMTAMRRYLDRLGIAPESVSLDDGAGLSRRNLSSSAAFVTLLLAHADDPAKRAFRNALPEAGIDGTLTGRLRDLPGRGKVFAKTGAMAQVASLAGYAITAKGERIAFALMLNNYVRSADSARMSAELDEIARIVIEAAPAP